jgi:thiamine biosynthesis lipoprotein
MVARGAAFASRTAMVPRMVPGVIAGIIAGMIFGTAIGVAPTNSARSALLWPESRRLPVLGWRTRGDDEIIWPMTVKVPKFSRRQMLLGVGVTAAAAIPAIALLERPGDIDGIKTLRGKAFGTRWHLALGNTHVSRPEAERLVLEIIHRIDRTMSNYRAGTEVMQLNAAAANEPVKVDWTTSAVLDAALTMSRQTEGAFDITIGPVVDLWGFGPTQRTAPPDQADVERLRAQLGWEQIGLDLGTHHATKTSSSVAIDLSGIAKGRAVDASVAALRNAGVTNLAMEIGGEVRCLGSRPTGEPWRIGIERPKHNERTVMRTLAANNAAFATSGTYRNYRSQGGQTLSHAVDPRTARPVDHGLVSVTVAARETMWADAWSTALLIVGPERALQLADDAGVAALFLVAEGGEFKEAWSAAFADLADAPSFQLPS